MTFSQAQSLHFGTVFVFFAVVSNLNRLLLQADHLQGHSYRDNRDYESLASVVLMGGPFWDMFASVSQSLGVCVWSWDGVVQNTMFSVVCRFISKRHNPRQSLRERPEPKRGGIPHRTPPPCYPTPCTCTSKYFVVGLSEPPGRFRSHY